MCVCASGLESAPPSEIGESVTFVCGGAVGYGSTSLRDIKDIIVCISYCLNDAFLQPWGVKFIHLCLVLSLMHPP